MKVVILAGGLGTRLGEETEFKPKPMVEIGGKPILWHIMKIYSHYGFNDFIICCGYKGYLIKEYFLNYYMHNADMTVDLSNNDVEFHNSGAEPWKVTLVDTGLNTMTGSRIKRIQSYVGNEPFLMTYGDGLGDVNIPALLEFHKQHKKLVTMTTVELKSRFGAIAFNEDNVEVMTFQEKPQGGEGWINGGFFVLQPEIFDYISNCNDVIWEKAPLETIAKEGQLAGYKHHGFWKPMDTLREKIEFETLWNENRAEWKLWN